MARVYRRKRKDGTPYAEWYYSWKDEHGRAHQRKGTTDKAVTRKIAEKLETEAAMVKSGLTSEEDRKAAESARLTIAQHTESYHAYQIAKGVTKRHADQTRSLILSLARSIKATRLQDLTPEAIQLGLKQARDSLSARSANSRLIAIKSLLRWCDRTGRISRMPRGIDLIGKYNERLGAVRVRRALTQEEVDRLLASTERGQGLTTHGTVPRGNRTGSLTGRTRAATYRAALATGLRANELRTLTADDFDLDSDRPRVVVRAENSKHRKQDDHPIRRKDAQWLKEWIAERKGQPLFDVPMYTAEMLRSDLEAAGIPYQTKEGVVDFHALRATYITLLHQAGVDLELVRRLARHVDLKTTQRYLKSTQQDLRDAIEGSVSREEAPKEGD